MAKLPRAQNGNLPTRILGRVWNEAADMIERALRVYVVPPLELRSGHNGIILSIRQTEEIVVTARITDQDGTDGWIYAWEQVEANVSGYTVVTSGLTGTVTDKPAKDINRQPYLRPGDFVLLRSTSEKQGDDSSKTIWEIVEQPESRGQYKGQVRATVAQNVEGHDWFRAHPATV